MACLFHKWDGCKCTKCGKTRDEGHVFENVSGKCQQVCKNCGTQIQLTHVWDGCTCRHCGQQTSYTDFDLFSQEDIVVFTTVVKDSLNKLLINPNITEKKNIEIKELLSRIETAANMHPFKIVKEDLGLALWYVSRYVNLNSQDTMQLTIGNTTYNNTESQLIVSVLYEKLKILAAWERKNHHKLTVPCSVTVMRPKLTRNGIVNNNKKIIIYLNTKEIGTFIAGDTLTATTDLCESIISFHGNQNPPIQFQPQSGGKVNFIITCNSIDGSFVIAPE